VYGAIENSTLALTWGLRGVMLPPQKSQPCAAPESGAADAPYDYQREPEGPRRHAGYPRLRAAFFVAGRVFFGFAFAIGNGCSMLTRFPSLSTNET